MDRLENTPTVNATAYQTQAEDTQVSMAALRQKLIELRKQARLHDREALVACLTLAIAIAKSNTVN